MCGKIKTELSLSLNWRVDCINSLIIFSCQKIVVKNSEPEITGPKCTCQLAQAPFKFTVMIWAVLSRVWQFTRTFNSPTYALIDQIATKLYIMLNSLKSLTRRGFSFIFWLLWIEQWYILYYIFSFQTFWD